MYESYLNTMEIAKALVRANGIIDIICGLSIWAADAPWNPFSRLHSDLFREMTPQNKRVLGYWILTYAIIRLCSNDWSLVSYSYLIEALAFSEENRLEALSRTPSHSLYKILFVIWSSFFMALLSNIIFFKENNVSVEIPF